MTDIPIHQCAERAEAAVVQGATVWQKWTCVHCGSRQTMAEPNKFYTKGICEECDSLTMIEECGFAAAWGRS